MICKFCGNEIDDGSDFCYICGQKVEEPVPAFAAADVYSQPAPSAEPAQAPVAEPAFAAAPAQAPVAPAYAAPAQAPVAPAYAAPAQAPAAPAYAAAPVQPPVDPAAYAAAVEQGGKKKKAKKPRDPNMATRAQRFFSFLLFFIVGPILYNKEKKTGNQAKANSILNATMRGLCVFMAIIVVVMIKKFMLS